MDNYKRLCEQLQMPTYHSHELKIALTHYSFSEKGKNGSRYVFLGQTEFKGKTARVLFDFVGGTGMQLQQYLGNLFKTKYLELLFHKFGLEKLIRYGENFSPQTHRHIFVFAFLGFVSDCMTPEALNRFIYLNFINNTTHLLPNHLAAKKDHKNQTLFLCKLHYNCKPLPEMEKSEDKYRFTLRINEELVAVAESKSYKYAQKKLWKKALQLITIEQEKKLLQNPDYLKYVAEQEEKARAEEEKRKEEKMTAYHEERQKRSEEIKENKKQKKEEAQIRDQERREAKERAKKRKELLAKQQKLKEMGMQNISSSKRRILEDRGILPKKK